MEYFRGTFELEASTHYTEAQIGLLPVLEEINDSRFGNQTDS